MTSILRALPLVALFALAACPADREVAGRIVKVEVTHLKGTPAGIRVRAVAQVDGLWTRPHLVPIRLANGPSGAIALHFLASPVRRKGPPAGTWQLTAVADYKAIAPRPQAIMVIGAANRLSAPLPKLDLSGARRRGLP